jgi:hypothetical protein
MAMAWCDIMCLPRALTFAGYVRLGNESDAADLAKLLMRFPASPESVVEFRFG